MTNVKFAVITAIGELHIHSIDGQTVISDVENFVSDKYGDDCNWQVITKTENHTSDNKKSYIFLTSDGSTLDGAGNDVENCQFIGTAKGENALNAFNQLLSDGFAGDFDTCFCYELSSENMSSFDLSDNIPAECENSECSECELSDDEKSDLDCPFLDD
jgi:hypothetical protein